MEVTDDMIGGYLDNMRKGCPDRRIDVGHRPYGGSPMATDGESSEDKLEKEAGPLAKGEPLGRG